MKLNDRSAGVVLIVFALARLLYSAGYQHGARDAVVDYALKDCK